ncbi:antennal-specific protein OS-C [Drosophila hydei]|uniref:Antennal-specific protein OS-C n=1 Tax=Drosophila hydei TaxID=7224 RepID=A0A6J1MCD2_DROHY|nr:antennal-specific protein OS-C [Drosophila hydei]
MAIHVGRQLLCAAFLLLLQMCISCEARPKGATPENNNDGANNGENEDDDSSSEETVEDSNEGRRRRRRREASDRAGIPGLPDPATIIKIAQLFQSVGEQIVPIILEALLPVNDATGERTVRDLQFLTNLKRPLEPDSLELQPQVD